MHLTIIFAGYVEDLSKGKMLRFEDSLPKLPVPTLEGSHLLERNCKKDTDFSPQKPRSVTSNPYILFSPNLNMKARKRQSRTSSRQEV